MLPTPAFLPLPPQVLVSGGKPPACPLHQTWPRLGGSARTQEQQHQASALGEPCRDKGATRGGCRFDPHMNPQGQRTQLSELSLTPTSDQELWLSSRHPPDEDHGEASSPGERGAPPPQASTRVRGGSTYHPHGTATKAPCARCTSATPQWGCPSLPPGDQ